VGDEREREAAVSAERREPGRLWPEPESGWGSRARGRRPFAIGVLLGIAPGVLVGAALSLAYALHALARRDGGVPLWDEAAQGFAGLRVAEAIRHLRPLELLRALNEQVVWPPLQSVLAAPFFLALGAGFDTPARAAVAMFVGLAIAALWAGMSIGARGTVAPATGARPPRHVEASAWAGGTLAAAAMLVSPPVRGFGSLGMLETPGALLVLLAFVFAGVDVEGRSGRRFGRLAGIATGALFLLKYNYALLWIAPLAIVEWSRLPADVHGAWRARLAAWLAAGRWRRPLPLAIGAWALLLVGVALTGGFAFEAYGRRVSMRSWGNPGYGLLVACTAWALVAWAKHRARWRARWHELPERTRALIAWAGVPILVWLLIPYPNRVKALAGFVANRATGPSPFSVDGLLYYPRAFANDYAPDPVAGWVVLALALAPPRRGASVAARLAWWSLIIGLAATWLHRYHDPRFLFTVAPFVWLNAVRTAMDVLSWVMQRARPATAAAVWVALAAGAAAAALAVSWPVPVPAGLGASLEARAGAIHRAYRAPAAVVPALDAVLDHTALAPGGPRPAVLLGYSNALSPGLLSWRLAQRSGRPRVPLDDLPLRPATLDEGAPDEAIAARIERLIAMRRRIVAALPAAGAAGAIRSEVWADSVTAARLVADPRVTTSAGGAAPERAGEEATALPAGGAPFPRAAAAGAEPAGGAGYRILVFDPLGP
jgi:hypothetical protein